MKIQIYVFKTRTTFFTVNHLADKFCENVDVLNHILKKKLIKLCALRIIDP